MTPEELEVRKAQWNLYTKVYLQILADVMKNGAKGMDWTDHCFDASSYAWESVKLFNDAFTGRGRGDAVKEERKLKRIDDFEKGLKNTIYDNFDSVQSNKR